MRIFSPLAKTSFFYGYRIVAVLFFCNAVVSGCMFYTFGLFVNSLETDFGWGRGDIMVASTIMALVLAATGPLIGRMVSQHGASKVIAIGAVIGGLGFIILTQMQHIWQFYAGYTLIGIGSGAVGVLPATTVISNWFKKRRGTALGIMSTGIGAGGLILAPLFGSHFIPDLGWRTSYLIFTLLLWVIIPLALFVVRTKPADMGLYPDGASIPEESDEDRSPIQDSSMISIKAAIATTTFWFITLSYCTSNFALGGIMQNQVPLLEGVGFSLETASTVVAIIGLGSLIGKLCFGLLCDRMPAKYVWCIALVLSISALIILININPASPMTTLYLYAICMGLGFGGWLPTLSMLISTNFGLASYSIIFGIMGVGQGIGMATGPLFAGYMYDSMQSYDLVFTVFLALFAVSVVTCLAIRRPKTLPHT